MIEEMVKFIVDLVGQWGYLGIFIMMTIESSFIPFPSEVVLIPAGYHIHQGNMGLVPVMIAALSGSMAGAYINYFLALRLGRAALIRYGKYIFIPEHKFLAVEKGFLEHGNFITFTCRLIFGIRQLISLPAGLARMPLIPFTIYTAAGAGIWSLILVSLGYILGNSADATNQAKLIGYWLLAVVVILSLAYYYWWYPKKKEKASSSNQA